MNNKKWTKEDNDIFIENYELLSNKELQKLFPERSIEALKSRANKIFKLRKKIVAVRIGNVEPLLLNTCETYYWVGFIFADGSILDGTRLSVSLSCNDIDHLYKLSKLLKCNINTYIRKNDNGKMCSVRVKDSKLIPEFCKKFDLKKFKTINPPIINITDDDLFISFLAGFIDGDGNITNIQGNRGTNIRIKLHSTWVNNLLYMEQRIYETLNHTKFRKKTLSRINARGYAHMCLSDNTLIKKLKNKVLELKLPIMSRKWDKINCEKISKYEVSNLLKYQVIDLLNQGYSVSKISNILDKKYQTIYGIIKRNNLKS